jgi:hypothetical protein
MLNVGLLKLLNGEHASATMMLANKDSLGNRTEQRMCKDHCPVIMETKLVQYPILMELFDAVGGAKVFGTLDLRSGYNQLQMRLEERVKSAFWGIYNDGSNKLFHWNFLSYGLKKKILHSPNIIRIKY